MVDLRGRSAANWSEGRTDSSRWEGKQFIMYQAYRVAVSSRIQGRREFRQLSDIKGVGWHSGSADKIGERCLDHGISSFGGVWNNRGIQ
jgi:hypothetical protein